MAIFATGQQKKHSITNTKTIVPDPMNIPDFMSPAEKHFISHPFNLNDHGKNINHEAFIKWAEESGYNIPENLSSGRNGAIDVSKINKSVTLIENILECGEMTAIIENKKIEPNIISILLGTSLRNDRNNTVKHLKNLSSSKTSVVFIDSENQQRYIRQFQALNFRHKNNFLYKTDFLDEPVDDGFSTFKNALRERSAKVVIFDADSVNETDRRKITILKNAIRYCKKENIAMVFILPNEKILQYLSTPDRLVHVWKKHDDKFGYIVDPEARLGEDNIDPFALEFNEGRWISKTLPRDILRKIPERPSHNQKPGVDPSMKTALENVSSDNLKDL